MYGERAAQRLPHPSLSAYLCVNLGSDSAAVVLKLLLFLASRLRRQWLSNATTALVFCDCIYVHSPLCGALTWNE